MKSFQMLRTVQSVHVAVQQTLQCYRTIPLLELQAPTNLHTRLYSSRGGRDSPRKVQALYCSQEGWLYLRLNITLELGSTRWLLSSINVSLSGEETIEQTLLGQIARTFQEQFRISLSS